MRGTLLWLVKESWWRIRSTALWLAKNSWLLTEMDRAEDAAFAEGINASCDEEAARQVLRDILGRGATLPDELNEDTVLRRLIKHFRDTEIATGESRDESVDESRDEWINLIDLMDHLRKRETNDEKKGNLRNAMNLLHAYNREKEADLLDELVTNNLTSTAAQYIKGSIVRRQRQLERFRTGVAPFPRWQKGTTMPWKERAIFYVLLFGILLINLGTEVIFYRLKEFVGVARNGPQRPRSLYQIGIFLFRFDFTDASSLGEIGRQRSLGAFLSFVGFFVAAVHLELYMARVYVICVGAASTLFQLIVQLGDLAWNLYKLFIIGKETRCELSWTIYLNLWLSNDLPEGTQSDQINYEILTRLNKRFGAWSRTYKKSKPMSILMIPLAAWRAIPRNVYAMRAGIKVTIVYDMRFWQKAAFPLATLPIWFASSYATWGMWYIFTMINAFHLVVYLKGQNMAFLVEHEVQAAYSTFCNMVMSSTPALVSVLIPRAFDKHYLESPDPLFGFVFLLIFFVTFWTDVLADGIKKLPEKIHTWHLSKRRQRSTTGTDSRETA